VSAFCSFKVNHFVSTIQSRKSVLPGLAGWLTLADSRLLWRAAVGRLRLPLLLAAALAAAAVPIVTCVGWRDPSNSMEKLCLGCGQETWLRWHAGDNRAWWLPSYRCEPRVVKPPLLVWLQLLSFSGMGADDYRLSELVLRARLASALLALLTLAATCWLACTLSGPAAGLFATLVLGSMFFFHYEARVCTYDMPLTAFVTLALAAGCWAVYGSGGGRSRLVWYAAWLLCGLALGCAWLTKGPIGVGWPLPALVAAAWSDRACRSRHFGGLAVALFTAACIAVPWYVAVAVNVPGAWRQWFSEWRQARQHPRPPFYYVRLLIWLLPWTYWLSAAAVGLWRRLRADEALRRRLAPALCWFGCWLLLLSLADAKDKRYALPLLPAASVLLAVAVAERLMDGRSWLRGRWRLHWAGLLCATLALTLVGCVPELLASLTGLRAGPLPPVSFWLLAGCLLVALVLLGWRAQARRLWPAALLATALWAMPVSSLGWLIYVTSDAGRNPIKGEGQRVARVTASGRLYHLQWPPKPTTLNEDFLLFACRPIPTLTPEELARRSAAAGGEIYVIASGEPAEADWLKRHHFRPLTSFRDHVKRSLQLWRYALGRQAGMP